MFARQGMSQSACTLTLRASHGRVQRESQLDEYSLSLLLRSVFEREEKDRNRGRFRVYVQNAPVCTFKTLPCVCSKRQPLTMRHVWAAELEELRREVRPEAEAIHAKHHRSDAQAVCQSKKRRGREPEQLRSKVTHLSRAARGGREQWCWSIEQTTRST